ncbi:hypothetical protein AYJ10_05865 [Serratia marcescens]|nr:hypothetical protein AYJ10_05865 [Serratia marcescens]
MTLPDLAFKLFNNSEPRATGILQNEMVRKSKFMQYKLKLFFCCMIMAMNDENLFRRLHVGGGNWLLSRRNAESVVDHSFYF